MKSWKRDYDSDREPDEPDDDLTGESEGGEYLELAGARLVVVGDELLRRNGRGGVILRLKLADIEDVTARRAFDPVSVVVLLGALGVAALGCFVSESNILTTVLYVVAFGGLLLAVFGCVRQQIDLTAGGKAIPVYATDNHDEVIGFAVSLQAEVRRARTNRPGPG